MFSFHCIIYINLFRNILLGTVRLYFKGSATAATLATTSNAATIAAALNALFTLSTYKRERDGGEGGREDVVCCAVLCYTTGAPLYTAAARAAPWCPLL